MLTSRILHATALGVAASLASALGLNAQRTRPTAATPPAQLVRMDDATPPVILRSSVTMTTASITWMMVQGAVKYSLCRDAAPAAPVCRDVAPGASTSLALMDAGLLPGRAYSYTVTATRADGHWGTSSPLNLTTAPPANPTNFRGSVASGGQLSLSWDAIPEAAYYWVQGPGVSAQQVAGTSLQASGIPPGTNTYSVLAYYTDATTRTADEAHPATTAVLYRGTSAHYRILVNAVAVQRQTVDQLPQLDGPGDEVYVAAFLRKFERTTNALVSSDFRETGVYKNVVYPTLIAGSIPSLTSMPLVLYDDVLSDGHDAILITPSVWEWDGDNQDYKRWESARLQSVPTVVPAGHPLISRFATTSLDVFPMFAYGAYPDGKSFTVDPPPAGRDRLIGLEPTEANPCCYSNDYSVVITRGGRAGHGPQPLVRGCLQVHRYVSDPGTGGRLHPQNQSRSPPVNASPSRRYGPPRGILLGRDGGANDANRRESANVSVECYTEVKGAVPC